MALGNPDRPITYRRSAGALADADRINSPAAALSMCWRMPWPGARYILASDLWSLATPKRKTKRKLKVLFDTSILFTQVAYDLTRPDVQQLIEKHSSHPDLALSWYLPRVVVGERQYQMQQRALALLPNLEKLQRLLGHKLNITPDILATRVEAAINDQIEKMSISVLDLDTNAVDWPTVIARAVRREPPFEAGDTEKGFRDCLIAQTFFQLVRDSPTTPRHCRLAVVTSDKRLAEYVLEETNEAKNVRVLVSVDDLESLINTLVSEVTEEFVSDLKSRVQTFFFEKTNKSGLYYSGGLRDRLREAFGDELEAVRNEGEHRENGTWRIPKPIFDRKEGQRTYWVTTIAVEAKLFEYQRPTVSNKFRANDPTGFFTDAVGNRLNPSGSWAGAVRNRLAESSDRKPSET